MDYNHYENLIPSQNYDKPKYMAYLRMLLDNTISGISLIESEKLAFNLNNAAGNQLDIIGEIVGVNRILPFVPVSGNRLLTDDEYKLLIHLKIARNSWDGTNEGALSVYEEVFGDRFTVSMVDNQDMSVTVQFSGDFTSRDSEILAHTGTLLIPAGVRQKVEVVGEKVVSYDYSATAISSLRVVDRVVMINDTPTLTVADVQEMNVAYLEKLHVKKIEE